MDGLKRAIIILCREVQLSDQFVLHLTLDEVNDWLEDFNSYLKDKKNG